MKIDAAWRDTYRTNDLVNIEGPNGVYTLTGEEIERMLIENNQMCGDCLDTGEVTTYEKVYPEDAGSPTAPIGTRKCHCRGPIGGGVEETPDEV